MKRYAISNGLKGLEKTKTFFKTLDEVFVNAKGRDVMEISLHPEMLDIYINSPHMVVAENSKFNKERFFPNYRKAREFYNKIGTSIHESDIKTVLGITEIGRKAEYLIKK